MALDVRLTPEVLNVTKINRMNNNDARFDHVRNADIGREPETDRQELDRLRKMFGISAMLHSAYERTGNESHDA